MSDVLLSNLGVLTGCATNLAWNSAFHGAQVEGVRGTRHTVRADPCPALPSLEPGQLWIVQFPSCNSDTLPGEYSVLTNANVLIYDRALAPVVSSFLPLGGYAEPAAESVVHETAVERCLGFARNGWSVARLVRTGGRALVEEFRQLSNALLSRYVSAPDLPIAIYTNLGEGFEKAEFQLGDVDLSYFELSRPATIVIGVITEADASNLSFPSTNGLAG
jgi:hypothetical protein